MRKTNYLEQYFEDKNVSFYDLEEEIDYSYQEDFSDCYHLSEVGAEKSTRYLNDIIFKEGISYILFLGRFLILYYVILKVLLAVTGTSLNTYASGNLNMSLGTIVCRIEDAYIGFGKEFIFSTEYLIPDRISRVVHIICGIMILGELVLIWLRKHVSEKIVFTLALVLLPLSINCMYIFTGKESIHTLVLYSFVSVYILAMMIAERNINEEGKKEEVLFQRFTREIIPIAMLIVLISNVYIGNQVCLHSYLRYENAYAFYTSLITQVKSTPGFDSDSRLALVGVGEELVHPYTEFNSIKGMSGADGFPVNSYSKDAFIMNYIGIDIPFASVDDINEIKKTKEFKEMEVYPYYGSIRKMDDFIVVKLGEQ